MRTDIVWRRRSLRWDGYETSDDAGQAAGAA